MDILGLHDRVGSLKLGTTWPLPTELLKKYLKICDKILFLEEIDPFLEENVKVIAAQTADEIGIKTFFGKSSGHIPATGELTPGILLDTLGDLFDLDWQDSAYRERIEPLIREMAPPREFGFCPGCPHRGSYYAIKTALTWDDRQGFVSGDIGCYTMGIWPTGFNQVKSVHAMGSGVGLANGYGKLQAFGFDQPVITVCGDSTFFHSGIPALVNAKFNEADILLLILDNNATAMTGFQPHPGTGYTATGKKTEPVEIEALCRSLKIHVEVADPYELRRTAQSIYRLMQEKGPRVLILRRKCALVQGREGGFPYVMRVDQDLCVGEACGCNRYCTRIFRCPGLVWNPRTERAEFDEVICVGCGICADICPQGAIIREDRE